MSPSCVQFIWSITTTIWFVAFPLLDNLPNAVFKSLTAVLGDNPLLLLFPELDTNITIASCHTALKLVTVFGISSYGPYIFKYCVGVSDTLLNVLSV